MSEAKVRVRVAHNAMHLPVVALRGLVLSLVIKWLPNFLMAVVI